MKHSFPQQKHLMMERLQSFRLFNEWEKNRADKLDDAVTFSAVFELYDLIPETARHRDVNVEGIMKMRKALSCLK